MPPDWSPLWLSLRYAGLSTLAATVVAVPLAALLNHRPFPASELLDAIAALPFLLPPAVLAYYLLSALGRWPLAFDWRTAILLSAIYTLPLILHLSRAALAAVDRGYENAARNLGASEWRVFWRILLPLAWRSLLAAILAGFGRAFADFGLTAVVAGSAKDAVQAAWLILPIAAASFGALYAGNRLRHARVMA
jgi:molybdate transport system permease protein